MRHYSLPNTIIQSYLVAVIFRAHTLQYNPRQIHPKFSLAAVFLIRLQPTKPAIANTVPATVIGSGTGSLPLSLDETSSY
jgi:hypothetical protein